MSFYKNFDKYSYPLLGLVRLPETTISEKDKYDLGLSNNATNVLYLKKLAWNGYIQKRDSGEFTGFDENTVKERLKMEFEVFIKTGIIDYLILVRDILVWCDTQKIARGPGRGSVCGSLSCYFLGITRIDSLKHSLNFTRFISEARAKPQIVNGIVYADGKSLCDIDSDISFVDRPKVINYVEQKYFGKTSKISTRLQLTGKTALKDILKIFLEYDETRAKSITDSIEAQFGKVEDLGEAIVKRKELSDWCQISELNQKAFKIAQGLEGINTARGQHPSGVFISYSPLDGNIPVELSKTKDCVTSNDMNVAATLGVKIDLLGLRSVDLIEMAAKEAGIQSSSIDINHPSIYEYLKNSDMYYGLFQIEDGLTKQVVRRVGPRSIEELSACLALSRPGSFKFSDDFVNFVKKGEYKPLWPTIDNILKPTGNILIYQEQINDICQKVYKLSAVDADEVRRAISKKVREDMAKWQPILFENGKKEGIPEEVTKHFWDICNASSDYLFSVNHSTAYAYITAQTVYLKANFPRQFIFSLLKLSRHEPDSQSVLNSVIAEAKKIGVEILPPDIIKSDEDFKIEENGIRFGLSHIKGVSDTTMSKLLSFKRNFENKIDIFNAAHEAKIGIAVLCGLIYSGCISVEGTSRPKLAVEAQIYNLLTPREQLLVSKLINENNNDVIKTIEYLRDKKDENGKLYIRESRMQTLRRDLMPYWTSYQENSKNEEFSAYVFERHFLGFSYSGNLYNIFSKRVSDLKKLDDVAKAAKKDRFSFVAFVAEVKSGVGKASKKPYIKYTFEDESGSVKAMLSGEDRIRATEQFNDGLPKEGDIVIVHASGSGEDIVFVDKIIIQKNSVTIGKSKEVA